LQPFAQIIKAGEEDNAGYRDSQRRDEHHHLTVPELQQVRYKSFDVDA
jgi:hypothetical protein